MAHILSNNKVKNLETFQPEKGEESSQRSKNRYQKQLEIDMFN